MVKWRVRILLTMCVLSLSVCRYSVSQTRYVINADRQNPFGVVTFPSSAVIKNCYVDGYVKATGSTKFIFPVGDNGKYRPFASSSDGVTGAYFQADPNTAVTSSPKGGNYPPLPSGAPFRTSSKNSNVGTVSTKEYWDVNSPGSAKLTLTWDASSGIAALLNNGSLSKLYIVAWTGSVWMKIGSAYDVNSVLGGKSTLTSGSISSTVAFGLSNYKAFTFGADAASPPSPLRTVEFAGENENEGINLKWKNNSEEDTAYLVEKLLADDTTWVNLSDASFRSKSFTAFDADPLTGRNEYRLRISRTDGSHYYKNLVVRRDEKLPELAIFPNPATDLMFVKVNDLTSIKSVTIFNLSGKELVTKSSSFTKAIDLKGFQPGIYIVQIEQLSGQITSKKLLIRR